MPGDDRDLLDVLKFELKVLERGGYGSSPSGAVAATFSLRGFAKLHEL